MSSTERELPFHFAVARFPSVVMYVLPTPFANHLSLGWCSPPPSQSKMRGPIFHRSPMQPSLILIRPTSRSSARDLLSSLSWFGVFPVSFTASSLDNVFPWNGTPTVVTGPGRIELTIPIGVLKDVETSPSNTAPIVCPRRLIGMPTVSCFTVNFVPCIASARPSFTINGLSLLCARPDFWSA